MNEAKPVSTPLANHFKLSVDQCPKSDKETQDMVEIPYASVVGCLMYVMNLPSPSHNHRRHLHLLPPATATGSRPFHPHSPLSFSSSLAAGRFIQHTSMETVLLLVVQTQIRPVAAAISSSSTAILPPPPPPSASNTVEMAVGKHRDGSNVQWFSIGVNIPLSEFHDYKNVEVAICGAPNVN
ncbi:Unknown protein [Striga hermonthica]|uniref:Uncharacterized protein n=1 Tax=Striga hermonthica TaxID=68872 RepID=A0A9N7NMP8_STRHE|nr:Unknown protein [Striga hermonthica]